LIGNGLHSLFGCATLQLHHVPSGELRMDTLVGLEAFQDSNALPVQPKCDQQCWTALGLPGPWLYEAIVEAAAAGGLGVPRPQATGWSSFCAD
jgi:hypothetical protein